MGKPQIFIENKIIKSEEKEFNFSEINM